MQIDNWFVSKEGFTFLNNTLNQIQNQIIEELLDEERAISKDGNTIIPHEHVVGLSKEELVVLGLPESYPFSIRLSALGSLNDCDFKYNYQFMRDTVNPFVNPKRVGSYLEICQGQEYLLSKDRYLILSEIDNFNSSEREVSRVEQLRRNLIKFAQIKGLSKQIGATLDSFLQSEEVVSPTVLTVNLKRGQNDILEVEPVLCLGGNRDQSIAEPILNTEMSQLFVNIFDRFEPRGMYSIPNGPRVVISPEQQEALKEIKTVRQLSGKGKESFLKAPQEFLRSGAFNFDNFGDRVIEIGEYKPRVFPFIRPLKENWLPPEGGILIDGEALYIRPQEVSSLQQTLSKALQSNEREVVWNGRRIPVTEEIISSVKELEQTRYTLSGSTSSEVVEHLIKRQGTKNVLIIKDNLADVDFSTSFNPRIGKISIPKYFKDGIQLLPHQLEGLAWLQNEWNKGSKGALLADDMGLGKTLQALSFLAWIREMMLSGSLEYKPMLIVAPVVLLTNWEEEYRRFFNPALFGDFFQLHGSNLSRVKNLSRAMELRIKKETDIVDLSSVQDGLKDGKGLLLNPNEFMGAGVVLTTYETLRDYQLSFGLVEWSVIVLDEAQKIKTPTAMMTTSVKAMKYDFGLCLTGTPVENSWVDLWSIMDFVQPGQLKSLKEFNQEFQAPLRHQETDREALGQKLKEALGATIKRRLKEQQLQGLPEKKIISYETEMPKEQVAMYMQIVNKAREMMPDKVNPKRKQHILQIIGALKDASLHPYLATFSEQGLAGLPVDQIISASARLSKAIEILEQIRQRKEKVIIFLTNRKMQRCLQRVLTERFDIPCGRPINGEVAGIRRKDFVDAFQQQKGFGVIIMSPEAAGVGLNVIGANHVIHLSRAWNPAKEDQATDRIYRIGQTLPVTVHLPLAVNPVLSTENNGGSFDQKLHRLLEQKRHLSRSVLLPPEIEEREFLEFGEGLLVEGINENYNINVTLDVIDRISPLNFEYAIAKIYEKQGYDVYLTPDSNDYGADVVVCPRNGSEKGFLIQCKHKSNPFNTLGPDGVQEILSALGVYKKSYQRDFIPFVVTNAQGYSKNALEVADSNDVKLCDREMLSDWLEKIPLTQKDLISF